MLGPGPLIVKPIRGWDGHGVRVISRAGELADLPAGKEPVFAQRYIAPEGPELKMFAIGGRVFGVKREVQLNAKDGRPGEPFTPAADLCRGVLRCGEAFGIELYGVDIIESRRVPHVLDTNSIPGLQRVPDAP